MGPTLVVLNLGQCLRSSLFCLGSRGGPHISFFSVLAFFRDGLHSSKHVMLQRILEPCYRYLEGNEIMDNHHLKNLNFVGPSWLGPGHP